MSDYIQVFDPPNQTRDCVHGQLARSCNICGLERELHEAKRVALAEAERANHYVKQVMIEVANRDKWRQCAERLANSCQYMGTTDAGQVMILTEKDRALANFNQLRGQ